MGDKKGSNKKSTPKGNQKTTPKTSKNSKKK